MAPIGIVQAEEQRLKGEIQRLISDSPVMIFGKSECPHCTKVKDVFSSQDIGFRAMDLDQVANGDKLQQVLFHMTGMKAVPTVFIHGKCVGGCSQTLELAERGRLRQLVASGAGGEGGQLVAAQPQDTAQVDPASVEFDLVVLGGGSGGLAAAKAAALCGKRVCVMDYVNPTPVGTSWGLGGTCVNVGCIPKKLMHQAALLRSAVRDAKAYGWQVEEESLRHSWQTLRDNVQDHIGSLNWNYRVQLRDRNITYYNAYGAFVDSHTVKGVNKRGKEQVATGANFLLAVGLRPRYPDIPGAREFGITSDDLFSLEYCPGKTLCVGASYVSLDCAGFLNSLGMEVTVMVRSILLRGFDQESAEKVGAEMEREGVRFIRGCVPTKVEQLEAGQPGRLRVYGRTSQGEEVVDVYNTVLFAIGRDACTETLGLDKIGVYVNPKNGKVPAINEQTNVPHVYAVGDVLDGRPELTPVAIQAGRLLSARLFANSHVQMDYTYVPTTVFTPLEYGCCGYSEEDAVDTFGADNIEVYHTFFKPLEDTVAQKERKCYCKLICLKPENERVVGLHVLSPHAGEITQGFGVAMKLGATKDDFDLTVGIHPTCAEVFTVLEVTKRSGGDISTSSC